MTKTPISVGNPQAPKNPLGTGRTYFTSKLGKRFYAKDYGHKCWPFGNRPKKPKP
jgi:hypothetical protein